MSLHQKSVFLLGFLSFIAYFCRIQVAKTDKSLIINTLTKMEDQNNPQDGQLQIELTPEIAMGNYANLAILSHSHAEFIADFVRVLPGMPKAPVVARIMLAPENAKRLLAALQDNVQKYEAQFGPIELPELAQAGSKTANPFGVPQGNA